MQRFSNNDIALATVADLEDIRMLLNAAYRGNDSKKGWTTEADLIAGEVRTDETSLRKVLHQPGSIFLKYTNSDGEIVGCVNLQQYDHKIYLGMFSVSPQLQGAGIGKALLNAAEEYAINLNCDIIYMSVISIRQELISWYKRHGYSDTGKRIPFAEDGVSGKHLQPLEFMILEKYL